jgi:hypothetical protein
MGISLVQIPILKEKWAALYMKLLGIAEVQASGS